MQKVTINHKDKVSKVQQIARSIARDIERGILKKDTCLPSINEFSKQHAVARDTVERAYKELKREGYIISVVAKGYFVKGKRDSKLRVLLVFNKLSSYKKQVYDSLVETLGGKATVDLQVHHYDPHLLGEIIDKNLGHYHYYVVMPHFFPGVKEREYRMLLEKIPKEELILLDKDVPRLGRDRKAVYQDFKGDIYAALHSAKELLKKYKHLKVVFPARSNHPPEIMDGVEQFCREQKKNCSVVDHAAGEVLRKGTAYIVTAEADLAQLIKKQRASGFTLGKEIGIISFNETVLKELLDITVFTTDFEQMGVSTARMILDGEGAAVRNPFRMILRKSL